MYCIGINTQLLFGVFHFPCTLPSHLMDMQGVSYYVLCMYIVTVYYITSTETVPSLCTRIYCLISVELTYSENVKQWILW